jgi:hypothetical protein
LAKSRPSRTSGELKSDFLHVIDSHRWLAVSGCIWNLVKPKAPGAFKESVEKLVPNIGVMARDSVLLHARSLIKFYKNVEGRDGTDILLKDFGVSISSPIERRLERREQADRGASSSLNPLQRPEIPRCNCEPQSAAS